MSAQNEAETATACVIVPHAGGEAILGVPCTGGWRLPRVELAARCVPTDHRLTDALRRQLGMETHILRRVGYPAQHSVVVLENRNPARSPPAGARWVGPGEASAVVEHGADVEAWFAESAGGVPDGRRPAWQRPGWFDGALAWIDATVASRGWERRGQPLQVRHTADSAVLRVPTSAGDLYFKAPNRLAAHEAALVVLLERVVPGRLAEPVAREPGAGWLLSRAVAGRHVVPDDPRLPELASELGHLQRVCADHVPRLLRAGCPDWRLAALPGRFGALVERLEELRLVRPDELRRCAELVPALGRVAARAAITGIPDTLVHGDFTIGNALSTDGGWVILDWSRGCVSHPFFDVVLLVQHLPDRALLAAVWDAYLEAWSDLASPAALRELVRAARPLMAAQYAVFAAAARQACEPDDSLGLAQGCAFFLRRFLAAMEAEQYP
jgi:hypothetical protein